MHTHVSVRMYAACETCTPLKPLHSIARCECMLEVSKASGFGCLVSQSFLHFTRGNCVHDPRAYTCSPLVYFGGGYLASCWPTLASSKPAIAIELCVFPLSCMDLIPPPRADVPVSLLLLLLCISEKKSVSVSSSAIFLCLLPGVMCLQSVRLHLRRLLRSSAVNLFLLDGAPPQAKLIVFFFWGERPSLDQGHSMPRST